MSESTPTGTHTISQTGLEPDEDVEPNVYAEEAARKLLASEPFEDTDSGDAAAVVRALDRLTYAVLGLVTEIARHPGGLTVVESAAPIVEQTPANALPGPFFYANGRRYAHTQSAFGPVEVDEHGVPMPLDE